MAGPVRKSPLTGRPAIPAGAVGTGDVTGVDVEVCTLGTTLTPTAIKNFPKGPVGEQVVKLALTPDEVADEAFEKLGKEFSIITGERNKKSVHDWKANHTEDEYIRYMGSFYADQD